MGSNYFGEPNYMGVGNERGAGLSSSSSSSRKGKKGNSDKPKQPQRGLGVAQLEKIRLNSQLGGGCTYLPSLHHPYPSPSNFNNQDDYRLHTAYNSSPSYSSSSSPSYGFHGHHGVMMGQPDLDKANITYGSGDSQPSGVARWHHGNAASPYGTPHYDVDPRITRSFFEPEIEGSFNKNMKERQDLMGTGSQNSESSQSEDIDLELRLSL